MLKTVFKAEEAAKWKLQDAVRMSASDPHVLSAALHEAKENDVNDVAPELMKQAEDTLKQAHESGRRLEVEQELERAMTAVSTDLKVGSWKLRVGLVRMLGKVRGFEMPFKMLPLRAWMLQRPTVHDGACWL